MDRLKRVGPVVGAKRRSPRNRVLQERRPVKRTVSLLLYIYSMYVYSYKVSWNCVAKEKKPKTTCETLTELKTRAASVHVSISTSSDASEHPKWQHKTTSRAHVFGLRSVADRGDPKKFISKLRSLLMNEDAAVPDKGDPKDVHCHHVLRTTNIPTKQQRRLILEGAPRRNKERETQ